MPATVESIRQHVLGLLDYHLKKSDTTFDRLDKDKSGDITAADFCGNDRAFKGFGEKYDTNADGKVTKEEYKVLCALSSLEKLMSIDEFDMFGIQGQIDMPDFRSMMDNELRYDLENEDIPVLVDIMSRLSTSEEKGVDVQVFCGELYKMVDSPQKYATDDSSKAILKECKQKLLPFGDKIREISDAWAEMDKNKDGFINDADYANEMDLAKIVRAYKPETSKGELYLSKREFHLIETVKMWTEQLTKALGSEGAAKIDQAEFLQFLTLKGVKADAAGVKTLYDQMSAVEHSVKTADFYDRIWLFLQDKL